MKYYTITVNGNTYHVSVQEGIVANAPAPVFAPAPSVAPTQAPVAVPVEPVAEAAPAPVAPVSSASAGSVKVNAPMPGKIVAIKTSIGQTVKKGEVILVLEAMKMENEIVSPQDGVVASIDVITGQTVEAGALLATLN